MFWLCSSTSKQPVYWSSVHCRWRRRQKQYDSQTGHRLLQSLAAFQCSANGCKAALLIMLRQKTAPWTDTLPFGSLVMGPMAWLLLAAVWNLGSLLPSRSKAVVFSVDCCLCTILLDSGTQNKSFRPGSFEYETQIVTCWTVRGYY